MMISTKLALTLLSTILVITYISGSDAQNCGLAGYGLSAVRFPGTTPYPYVLLDSTVYANSSYDNLLNFTIQGWVWLNPGATNTRTIVVKAPRTNNGDNTYNNGLQNKQEFSLEVTGTNNLRFRMGCELTYGFDMQTMGALPTGRWTNVAVTMNYQTAQAQLYVNGALQTLSTGSATGNWSSQCSSLASGLTGPYRVAFYPGGAVVPRVPGGKIQVGLYSILYATTPDYMLGMVDELSIWSTVLTEEQLTANTASGLRGDESGLVSYHSFNEGQGTAAYSPFPSTGPFRFAPAGTPVIPGYLFDNVQWTPSSLQLDYPVAGIPYSTNQGTKLPLFGIESPNITQNVLYYNITSLPLNGYLTGYPSISPRGSLSTASTTEVTLQLYDILQNTSGNYPVVTYHSNRNFLGTDSFTFTTYALESNGYVSCSATGPNSGARVYLSSACAYLDSCGVCNGDNSTCHPTPPVYGNGTCCIDACGVPGGDGSSCAGCDGIPNSGTVYDDCGICGGNNTECADCNGIPNGPNPPNECGCCFSYSSNGNSTFVCPGGETNSSYCLDCNGCPFGTSVVDACGVCGGDNTTCIGCDGTLNGPTVDLCGVCPTSIFGDDSSCGATGSNGTSLCDNVPNVYPDECGVCGGDNSTCQCVFYKNYQIAQMDCALLEFTINNTLCIIDELITELELSLAYIFFGNYTSGSFEYHLIQNELLSLNRFIYGSAGADYADACVDNFCAQISDAITRISNLVPQPRIIVYNSDSS